MNAPTHPLNPTRRELLRMFALDVELTSGSGFSLRDAGGRDYLDFLSQYGALPFGHNPPEIWHALRAAERDQMPVMVQPLRSRDAERLAGRLAEITPGDLAITTFTNSGAETVEAAIKLARMRTGRTEILSAANGFHGKTLGALSATGRSAYQDGFGAPVAGFAMFPTATSRPCAPRSLPVPTPSPPSSSSRFRAKAGLSARPTVISTV